MHLALLKFLRRLPPMKAVGPDSLSAVLAVVLVAVTAKFVSATINSGVPQVTLPSSQVASANGASRESYISGIVSAHLFGNSETSARPAVLPPNLQLFGTLAFDDAASGFAILGESATTARLIRAGAGLSGGAVLRSVFRNRVVVESGGRFDTLFLPSDLPPGVLLAMMQPVPDASGIGLSIGSADRPRGIVGKKQMRAESRAMYDFPPELGRAAVVSVVMDGTRLRGYRLEPGRDPVAFKALGMQSGDIVIAVNGYPVWHPQGRLAMANSLLPGEQIEVSVQRGTGWTDLAIDGKRLAGMTLVGTDPLANRPGRRPTGK